MRHKRRTFVLIYPQFQLRLIFFVVGILVISNAVLLIQLLLAHHFFVGLSQDLNLPSSHSYFAFLEAQRSRMSWQLGIASLVSVAISILVLLHLSHKIAEPIVKLRSFLKRATESESAGEEPLSFRKGDFFTDLPPVVNDFIRAHKKNS
jgi:sensor histidine kinase YesM